MQMSRPSEYTRNAILKAAVALFAERGYDGTSIRAIVSKARVNQAAINYHFKGKEGLYFEVLKVAFEGYLRLDNFDPERLKAVSYTHLRAHETDSYLVCRLLLEKKK